MWLMVILIKHLQISLRRHVQKTVIGKFKSLTQDMDHKLELRTNYIAQF